MKIKEVSLVWILIRQTCCLRDTGAKRQINLLLFDEMNVVIVRQKREVNGAFACGFAAWLLLMIQYHSNYFVFS